MLSSLMKLKTFMVQVGLGEEEAQRLINENYNEFKHLLLEKESLDILVKIVDLSGITPPEKLLNILDTRQTSVAINMKGHRLWFNDITGHFSKIM